MSPGCRSLLHRWEWLVAALLLAARFGFAAPSPSPAVPPAADGSRPTGETPNAIPDERLRRLRAQAREHWAFQPVRRPAPPASGHPVDAFVVAALRSRGLALQPEAAPRDLIRRITFDLLGLPPTPDEIAAFEGDPAPDRFERLVDQLLARPQYGERWARHWLDLARFSESQGFEYDRLRENAWPYRDYVIRSFNEDKPYDRFMREQIAGDVLEPVTLDGLVGPSLLVCGSYDQAGNSQANATQRLITREEELEDLLSVVGQTFLGLTLNCARCHDHKFDPIPLADYYRLKAVFDGVQHGERPLETPAETRAREDRLAGLDREIDAARRTLGRLEAEGARRVAARRPTPVEPGPVPYAAWIFDGRPAGELPGELHGGATVADGRLQLPAEGAFFQSIPLTRDIREKTLEAWVSLASLRQGGGAPISIESADGRVFDALVFGERQAGRWTAGSEGFSRTRDLDAPEESADPGVLVHLAVVYHADNRIAVFRNGKPYGQAYPAGSPIPTFRAGDARVVLGRRHLGGGRPWFTGSIRQAALHDRALTEAEIAASFGSAGLAIPTAESLAALDDTERAEHAAATAQATQSRAARAALSRPAGMAYAGKRIQPAPTRLLPRGDVKSPGETLSPAALSALESVDGDLRLAPDAPEAERRRRFADWLADPRNPLPARVMVNRIWQHHFGQGLVATPSDFGASGARPSHPELLDWLAAEFSASGWSVKALHRLIVTSAAYRQSSRFDPAAAELDADNQLLWRFGPRRLDAEVLRDSMLAVSGQLDPAVGGPSFRPFTTTEFGATFYHLLDSDEPAFRRRTIYRMNVNSGKDPLLDVFDCPDPAAKTPRRGVTTTPLQALGLMNSAFVQRQARRLAERATAVAGNDLPGAIDAAYRLALGRPPSPAETRDAVAVASTPDRGLASVGWVLLNSTEFLYVR